MLENLRRLFTFPEELSGRRHDLAGEPANSPLNDAPRQRLMHLAEEWQQMLSRNGFVTPVVAAGRLREKLAGRQLSNANAIHRLDEILEYFLEECSDRRVEILPPEKARFYDGDFGHHAKVAVPSATAEIKEASTCYALGRNTACVFHLMRGIEHAMREIAVALGVTNTTVPLEFQVWQSVIQQIEARADDNVIAKWPEPSKSNARAFFASTIADLYAFKDATRNVLMHARSGGTYDAPAALSMMNRAREFFGRLEGKIEEGSHRALLDPARFT